MRTGTGSLSVDDTLEAHAIPAGVLAQADLARMASAGAFGPDLNAACLQPASVDLDLGYEAYEVDASFLPNGRTVREALLQMGARRIAADGDGPFLLERGRIYIFRLAVVLDLQPGLHARFNPKSSTGRIDVFARVISDRGRHFDLVPDGYRGEIWMEIAPRSFDVVVRRGSRLGQMRVVSGDGSALHDSRLRARSDMGSCPIREGAELSLDLTNCLDGVGGWVARDGRKLDPIDVDRVGVLSPEDYFEPVGLSEGTLLLVPSRFYILRSIENVAVPHDLAGEMVVSDTNAGEFRAHYAGFFDPGFGVGDASRAVLEIRARDVPFLVTTGQVVGRIVYHAMSRTPEVVYGQDIASNYQGQGLRLSKHFRNASPTGRSPVGNNG